jgi:hypothetical protein
VQIKYATHQVPTHRLMQAILMEIKSLEREADYYFHSVLMITPRKNFLLSPYIPSHAVLRRNFTYKLSRV